MPQLVTKMLRVRKLACALVLTSFACANTQDGVRNGGA
jgi:hypothetical protein